MTIANSTAPSVRVSKPSAVPVSEPAWEIARLFPDQGYWTEADYLELNTNRLVEFVSGKVEVLTMPTDFHQAIVAYLFEALLIFIRNGSLGTVRFSALPMKTVEGHYREPDILFLKRENDGRRTNDFWETADLVMEIVSTHDRKRDLETKRFEYARAGIGEYWIVDPMLKQITVVTLNGDRYDEAGLYSAGTLAKSVLLPGFAVDVTATFAAK